MDARRAQWEREGWKEGGLRGKRSASAVHVSVRDHLIHLPDFIAGDSRNARMLFYIAQSEGFVEAVEAARFAVPIGPVPAHTRELRGTENGPEGGGVHLFLADLPNFPANPVERHLTAFRKIWNGVYQRRQAL